MVKSSTIAALCVAIANTANAGVQTSNSPLPQRLVTLQAVIANGTVSNCGMREAPHLIEHLLLSDTSYGDAPLDAILALRTQGIKLSALTHSDFTEYTLEGPPAQAEKMSKALIAFLGRPSIPKLGFEREKTTILREVRASRDYTSSPTFYERFIAAKAGARKPCSADSKPFMAYEYDDVQRIYKQYYTPDAIKLIARASPGTFDLKRIASELNKREANRLEPQDDGIREKADSIKVIGRVGVVELFFPIAGRATLPQGAANALADQARLEIQAHIRKSYQLYTARSFVDQSLVGGWIRLEIPNIAPGKAGELRQIALGAMNGLDFSQQTDDPIWVAFGSKLTNNPVGKPMIAEVASTHPSPLHSWVSGLWKDLTTRGE